MPEKLTSTGRVVEDMSLPVPVRDQKSVALRNVIASELRNIEFGCGLGPSLYLAPGGLDGLPLDKAYTLPTATPAPAISPSLINRERVRFCLAGAIAAPAGLDAIPPRVLPACAAAVPAGSLPCCELSLPEFVLCVLGASGKFCRLGDGVALFASGLAVVC